MTNVYGLFAKAGGKKTKQLKRQLMGRFGSEATISHDGLVELLQKTGIADSQIEGRLAAMALAQKWIPLGKSFLGLGRNYLFFEKMPNMAGYNVSVRSDFLYDGEA